MTQKFQQPAAEPPEEQPKVVNAPAATPEYDVNLYEQAEEWRPTVPAKAAPDGLLWFSQVKPKSVKWLWAEMFPLGLLSTLIGPSGVGKTSLICGLIGRTNRGVLDGSLKDKSINVAYFNLESGAAETLTPKLIAAQAEHCLIVDENNAEWRSVNLATDAGIDKMEQLIDDMGLKWLIFDPGLAFFRTKRSAMSNTAEVTVRLTPLAALASRKNVAITFVMHIKPGKTAVEAASVNASMGFTNVARHNMVVGHAGEDLVVGVMQSEVTEAWRGYLFHLDFPAGVLADEEGVDMTPSQLRILGPCSSGQVQDAWKRVEDIADGTTAMLEAICNAIDMLNKKSMDATRAAIFAEISTQWEVTQKRFDSVIRDGIKRFFFADKGTGSGSDYHRPFKLLQAGKALVTPRPPSGNRKLHNPATGPALRIVKQEEEDGSF